MARRKAVEIGTGVLAALAVFACGLLFGCAAAEPQDAALPKATYYTVVVRPGDTLARVAQRYMTTETGIAELNHLGDESHLRAGQILEIPAGDKLTRDSVLAEADDIHARSYPPALKRVVLARADMRNRAIASAGNPFAWPLKGPVIAAFGSLGGGERNDGINIAVRSGTPIHAAAAGTVTYAGNELKGYGNLVLIQHDDGYVTAYAHAESIAVSRGDHVDKGQVIGLAGATGDVDRPQLHFEIRKGIEPINPRLMLASRG